MIKLTVSKGYYQYQYSSDGRLGWSWFFKQIVTKQLINEINNNGYDRGFPLPDDGTLVSQPAMFDAC